MDKSSYNGFGNEFMDMTSKKQEKYKLYFIKIK